MTRQSSSMGMVKPYPFELCIHSLLQLRPSNISCRHRHCDILRHIGCSSGPYVQASQLVHLTPANCLFHGDARIHLSLVVFEERSLSNQLFRRTVLSNCHRTHSNHRHNVRLSHEDFTYCRRQWHPSTEDTCEIDTTLNSMGVHCGRRCYYNRPGRWRRTDWHENFPPRRSCHGQQYRLGGNCDSSFFLRMSLPASSFQQSC